MNGEITKKRGRPPAVIDLARVQELAAKGVNRTQAAAALGVSRRTIQNRMEDDPAFQAAHNAGLTKWRDFLSSEIKTRLESGKGSDLLLIAAANQPSGLGWQKPGTHVEIEGQIDVVYVDQVLPALIEGKVERLDSE